MSDLSKMTPAKLLRMLRTYSTGGNDSETLNRLWVVEHDKQEWFVTGHFAFRPHPYCSLAARELWSICNLTFEPMQFTAGLAVTRMTSDVEAPAFAMLVPDEPGEPIEPRPLSACALVLEDEADRRHVMWRRQDGAWSTFDVETAKLVLSLTEPGEWKQAAEYSAASCWSPYGDLQALLMPVQLESTGRLFRDPELPPMLFEVGP